VTTSQLLRTTAALFEQLNGQPFEAWLHHQRDRGRTLRQIADDLTRLTDGAVTVVPQTILNWTGDRMKPVA